MVLVTYAQIAGAYIQTLQPSFLCDCKGAHPQCRLLQKQDLPTLVSTKDVRNWVYNFILYIF